MKNRRSKRTRRVRRQRGGGPESVLKHQILTQDNGFHTEPGNVFVCGQTKIPYHLLLTKGIEQVKDVRCSEGEVIGFSANSNSPQTPKLSAVQARIAALKNAAPPPQSGRIGNLRSGVTQKKNIY